MPGRRDARRRFVSIRRTRDAGGLLLHVSRRRDARWRPWFSPPGEQKRCAPLENVFELPSVPASITAPLILPRDPHASVHAGPRENAWQTLSAFVRCGPGSTPVRRLGASEPTSFLSSAGEDRHPPVEPWRVRWRSPAWSSVRRAFLLERDQSLHVQIRPLALMGPGRRASPCEPA